MSSLEVHATRRLARLGALAGVIISLSSCHSTGKDLWRDCCTLHIVKDQTADLIGRRTIIGWQGVALFGPDGSAQLSVEGTPSETSMKRRVKTELAEFLATNQGSQGADYFLSLGMSCARLTMATKDAVSRCEIELPITAKCYSRSNMFVPWEVPVPSELRRPISAYLHVSIEVSANTLLDVSTRIDPVPGGRLCQR